MDDKDTILMIYWIVDIKISTANWELINLVLLLSVLSLFPYDGWKYINNNVIQIKQNFAMFF